MFFCASVNQQIDDGNTQSNSNLVQHKQRWVDDRSLNLANVGPVNLGIECQLFL